MYGITVDSVIINRILPMDEDSGYLNHWKGIQQKYMLEVEHSFSPLPIHRVPFYAEEVVGIDKLRQMGLDVYGDTNPTTVYYEESPMQIGKANGHYNVRLKLPFLSNERLDLFQNGDELVIQIGDFRRIVSLPTSLAGLEAGAAEFQGKWLVVPFGEPVISARAR
jgi:arsenite-transporting ATPase